MLTILKTRCPSCQAVVKVTDSLVGKRVRCPACKQPFEVASVEASLSPSLDAAPQASETMAAAASDTSVAEDEPSPSAPISRDPSAANEPKRLGRFELREVLGQGAFGRVYRAHDPQLDREVALKVPTFGSHEKHKIQRFLAEAKAAARLRHPHICPVFEVGEVAGTPYIAMAYIEGRPLSHYVRAGKPIPLRAAVQVVRKLALALDHAHAGGIVHRDLKPANIMMDQGHEPIVMDFGLALRDTSEDESRMTKAGVILGTPGYMSPEQVEGDQLTIGPRTDIYSLGVILYELLTGRAPFTGSLAAVLGKILTKEPQQARELRGDIDVGLEEICRKMMAKRLDDRYASMKEVAAALADWLKSSGQPAVSQAFPSLASQAPPESTDQGLSALAASIWSKAAGSAAPAGGSPLARRRAAASARGQTPLQVWIAAAAGGLLIVVLGVVFMLRTPDRRAEVKKQPAENSARQQASASGAKGVAPLAEQVIGGTLPAKTSPAPADAVVFQGHEYKYFGERISWKEAKRRCEQMGGHLPIIESAAENAFVTRLAEGGFPQSGRSGWESVWLAATDEVTEGDWRWTDNKRLLYTNWLNGQPNNKQSHEHFAILWLSSDPARESGQWSDQPNVSEQHAAHFICEWDGTPAAGAAPSVATTGATTSAPTAAKDWIVLFNGRDLTGWRRYTDDQPVAGGWVVEGGAIHRTSGGGDIMATGEYRDFELEFQWKISQGGNSGVIYRARTGDSRPWESGPEYQLLDDAGHVNGAKAVTSAGSIYGILAPQNKTLRPVGEWNMSRIVARGNHLEHWLNGSKVVEAEVGSASWKAAAPQTGFGQNSDFATTRSGRTRICLQDHGHEVWFRNIRVREL